MSWFAHFEFGLKKRGKKLKKKKNQCVSNIMSNVALLLNKRNVEIYLMELKHIESDCFVMNRFCQYPT